MNSSEATIVAYITAQRITQTGASQLLQLVRDPAFRALDIRSVSWNNWVARLYTMSAHGLHTAQLTDPTQDGTNSVIFVHRSAWDVLQEFVMDPKFCNQMTWGFQPEFDASGERVYGEISSGRWLESVYGDLADPDATVILVLLASDAFKTVQIQKEGHPFYMTLGNLPTTARLKDSSWKCMGFKPKLVQQAMSDDTTDFSFRRRDRQVFQGCVCQLLRECREIWTRGGQLLRDCNGVWRKVMPLLCMYITDRQEHEMVVMAHMHSCFHCCSSGAPFDVGTIRDAVMRAALTGEYGDEEEWRKHLQTPKPIVAVKEGRVHVIAATRYEHASSILQVHPEYNLLWDFTPNIYQSCRDDPLHQMALGMMPRVMEAVACKYIAALHPQWALDGDLSKTPGTPGMMQVWARLGGRLRKADPKQRPWTTNAWCRAYELRQKPPNWQMKWGMTGQEHSHQFELLPFCLPGLVQREVSCLNGQRPPGTPAVVDPSKECILAVCTLLDYNAHCASPYHSERSLRALHEEALALMRLLREIMPSRDCRTPLYGRDDSRPPTYDCWDIPKAHSLAHDAAGRRLFGR